jgi:DNA adenine methylase
MMKAQVRPVLKWAGGKSRSVPHISGVLPQSIETYYEPFVGGAAVFFALASQGRFKKAVLSDKNKALIDVYRAVKNARVVGDLIRILQGYRYDRDEYYRVRAIDPQTLELAERAARVIFLNKTGYNGLYRVNSRGQFNVPFGRHRSPTICDADNLRAAHAVLKKVSLEVSDFEEVTASARPGDAVYFDPPYDPVSKTSNFTSYYKEEFGPDEHERLAKTFAQLVQNGVHAVLSNSSTALTNGLFSSWKPTRIPVSRPINSKADARGAIDELLVVGRPSAKPRTAAKSVKPTRRVRRG